MIRRRTKDETVETIKLLYSDDKYHRFVLPIIKRDIISNRKETYKQIPLFPVNNVFTIKGEED